MKLELFFLYLLSFFVDYVSYFHKIKDFLFFFQSLSDKYDVELLKIEPLPEPNVFVFDTLRVKKYNRSIYVIDGDFTITSTLDDSNDFVIIGNNFQGRQYKKLFDKKYKKLCTTIFDESFKDSYVKAVATSNLPKFGDCSFLPVRLLLVLVSKNSSFYFFFEGKILHEKSAFPRI